MVSQRWRPVFISALAIIAIWVLAIIGFKQMLTAFEQLPEEQRRRTIEDTLRRLKESRARGQAGEGFPEGTNGPPPVSKELQAKIRNMDLNTFYSQSSAQMKAELAPM